jgi:hypothetical protein
VDGSDYPNDTGYRIERQGAMTTIAPNRERYAGALLRDPCVYCGGVSTTLDHIRARVKGGMNGWPNRAPCCEPCNQEKAAKRLLFYLFLLAGGVWHEPHRQIRAGPRE